MLEYENIDIPERIDVNKAKNFKECSLHHYWYFTDKNFNYRTYFCNGCYMSMKVVSIKNLAISSVKENTYRVNFAFMTKNDATKLLKNSDLNNKGVL